MNASKVYTEDSVSKIERAVPKILACSSFKANTSYTQHSTPNHLKPVIMQNFKRRQNKYLKPLRDTSNKKIVTERFAREKSVHTKNLKTMLNQTSFNSIYQNSD